MKAVQQVVHDLGPTLVVGTGGDLERAVRAVTVTDPAHPAEISSGTLVIGVGHTAGSGDDLLREAAEAGATGVVLKGTSMPTSASATGMAVVVVEPAADWGHVIALTRMSLDTVPTLGNEEVETLFAVADAVAGLCGGPVVIHDAAWQLLAYSGGDEPDVARTRTLLGRRVPQEQFDRLRVAGLIDRLLRGEVVHVADGEIEDLGERYAAAVLVGGQVFGSIWVMPTAGLDETQAREGLRRGVDVAALALLRQASFSTTLAPEHDPDFAALLSGMHTERIVAERLGSSVDGGFVLAGLRPLASDAIERAATARRLVALARSYCEAYRVTALTAPVADTAYLIFPCATADDRVRAVRVLTELHGRLRRSAAHRAMVSSTYEQLGKTVAVRTMVEELLELAERRGWPGLTDSETVQASWRLAQFREVALAHPALLEGPAMRLLEHDRAHGSGLVETLRAYFEAVGDVKVAAENLRLHANTVRYRLRRVEEVADLRLDHPDERLLAELQVRLLAE